MMMMMMIEIMIYLLRLLQMTTWMMMLIQWRWWWWWWWWQGELKTAATSVPLSVLRNASRTPSESPVRHRWDAARRSGPSWRRCEGGGRGSADSPPTVRGRWSARWGDCSPGNRGRPFRRRWPPPTPWWASSPRDLCSSTTTCTCDTTMWFRCAEIKYLAVLAPKIVSETVAGSPVLCKGGSRGKYVGTTGQLSAEYPPLHPTKRYRSVVTSPAWSGGDLTINAFWRILKDKERPLYIFWSFIRRILGFNIAYCCSNQNIYGKAQVWEGAIAPNFPAPLP